MDKLYAICYTVSVEFYKFIFDWFIGIFHIFMKFLKENFKIFARIANKELGPQI
jgi:hypothetical protein